jgi:hypothetical protein
MTDHEKAKMIAGMIFAPMTTPDIISKNFKRVGKKYIVLMTELLAYRVFITDFTLFTFYAHTSNYQTVKSIMMDKYVAEFWNGGFSEGLITYPLPILSARMMDFAKLYESHDPEDSNAVGYSCARMMKNAGLEVNVDFTPNEYMAFRLKYFDSSIGELQRGIQRVMSDDMEKRGESFPSYINWIIFAIIAFIAYTLLK